MMLLTLFALVNLQLLKDVTKVLGDFNELIELLVTSLSVMGNLCLLPVLGT
jgi:hypothetical protein